MKKKITCVFCKGTGQDSFALPEKLAACQVCGGKSQAGVAEPAIKCAFCAATGIYPRNALVTRIFCNGKSLVTFIGATVNAKVQTHYNG